MCGVFLSARVSAYVLAGVFVKACMLASVCVVLLSVVLLCVCGAFVLQAYTLNY